MKFIFGFLFLFLSVSSLKAQVTWASDVAPIFYESCTKCHHDNGIAPFTLIDYATAQAESANINAAIFDNTMPPWKPDSSYQHYAHERILDVNDRQTILDWYSQGSLEGNPALAPPPPIYSSAGILGTPDLKLTIPTHISNATATSDDYVCFSLPTNLANIEKIKAIEIVPGDPTIVHHCIVYYDEDNSFGTDSSGNCIGPFDEKLLTGYAPGGLPSVFPNSATFKTGMTLPAGGSIILSMHYPEGSDGMVDSTSINIYFHQDTNNVREIFTGPLLNNNTFCVQPDTVELVTNYSNYTVISIPEGASLLSVFPHMHLLGQKIISWAEDPLANAIPMIKIDDWDMEWQDFYYFDYLKEIPYGSTFHAEAVFDNTVNNPVNPNNPPDTVCFGYNTEDEMFLVYAQYMAYETGDELINQDSIFNIALGIDTDLSLEDRATVLVYPNPFSTATIIELDLQFPGITNLFIYDQIGNLVMKLQEGPLPAGTTKLAWDGKNAAGIEVGSGLYHFSLNFEGTLGSGNIIKH